MTQEQQLLEWCNHKLAELRLMAADIETGQCLPRSEAVLDQQALESEYRSLAYDIDSLATFVHDYQVFLDRSPA